MAYDRQIKKYIGHRKWGELENRWIDHIPFIDPPGTEPDPAVSSLLNANYAPIISELFQEKTGGVIYSELEGLRETILREGIFLLHKAYHVVGNAELDLQSGYKTWALTEAYQSSLFGAKAIINFLGVGFAQIDNKGILIDVWPEKIKKHNQKAIRITDAEDDLLQLVHVTNKIEHRHIWMLFQRLLKVSKVNIWPQKTQRLLRNFDKKLFSKQRNIIHYYNHRWIFNDLYEFLPDSNFGTKLDSLEKYEESGDFSFVLSLVILKMGTILFESINDVTGKLAKEYELITNDRKSDRHRNYKIIKIE